VWPCIAIISLKCNQQDATFSGSIYFYKLLYMFQAVSLPIIRSTKLYIQRQVLSNQYWCLLLSCMRWNEVPSHPSTCFRRFLRPSSGAHYCTYGVRCCQTNTAAIVDEIERFLYLFISINCSTCFRRILRPSSGAHYCTDNVRYCQTNTAVLVDNT
jgi:hypothetical protein